LIGIDENNLSFPNSSMDFDARAGHNYGAKYKFWQNKIHCLNKIDKSI